MQFRSGEDESAIYSGERISLIKSKQTSVICFCETMLIKREGDGLIMHNFTSTIGEICYNTKSDGRFARECQQPHQLGAGISAQQSFRPQCPQWIASHIAMAKAQQGIPFTRLTNTGSCILATLLTQPSYIQIHRVGSH